MRHRTPLFGLVVALIASVGLPGVALEARPHGHPPPPGYYDAAAGLHGPALRAAIHEIIRGHTRRSYAEVWPILALADGVDAPPGEVRSIYKNALFPANDTSQWTREHAWPKSYGFPTDERCNDPYTDAHHLFAADRGYNSSRNNGIYDNCAEALGANCVEKPVDGHPDTPNFRRQGTGEWEVWLGRRGDIARAMFYMDVRYDGDPNPDATCAAEGKNEPDLILTDDLAQIQVKDGSPAYMGDLCSLIVWDVQDPVSVVEQERNDIVYDEQGNRNPFVDHPEWVFEIWQPCASEPIKEIPATATATSTVTPTPTTPQPTLSITPGPTTTLTVEDPTNPAYLPYVSKSHELRGSTPTPTLPPTATRTATPAATDTLEPSSTPTASSTAEPSDTPTASPTSPPTATPSPTVPAPAAPRIAVLHCDSRDEYVRVDNDGGTAASLSGWDIFSVVGSQTYHFPGYTLNPGESVYVHSGPDAPPTSGNNLHWTGAYIWNNGGDSAQLWNPGGAVVSERDC